MVSAKNPEVRLAHVFQQIDIVAIAIQDLTPELRNRYQDAHWQAIICICNLLRHEYCRINPADM